MALMAAKLTAAAKEREEILYALEQAQERNTLLESSLSSSQQHFNDQVRRGDVLDGQLSEMALLLSAADARVEDLLAHQRQKDEMIHALEAEIEGAMNAHQEDMEQWELERRQLNARLAQFGVAPPTPLAANTATVATSPMRSGAKSVSPRRQQPPAHPDSQPGSPVRAAEKMAESPKAQVALASEAVPINNDLKNLKDKLAAKQREMTEELARTQKLLAAAEDKLKRVQADLASSRDQTVELQRSLTRRA